MSERKFARSERKFARSERKFAAVLVAAMPRLAWVCVTLLFAAALGCGGAESEAVRVQTSGADMLVSLDPAAPRVGENTLELALEGEGGAPIENADVGVKVHMHAMGAMPAMGGPATVTELGGGRYRADFELRMGGTWLVEIAAKPGDGRVARAEGSLTVGSPNFRLAGLSTGSEEIPAGAVAQRGADESGDAHPAEFRLDEGRLQRVGVKVSLVAKKKLETRVRAVGRVVAEETTLADVALKVRGWVGKPLVDAVGDPVKAGDVLFTLYSPELYAAQQEYLQALASQARARATSAPLRADSLVRAAHNRLRLWDIAEADIEQLVRTGEPREHLPIRAPVSGYVVEKNLVAGGGIEPGQRLYRIAPLSRVWVEADVYEFELSLVHAGQMAKVSLPYVKDREFEAEVAYVYPTLDPVTRTARLRLALANPDLALRPGMYANVSIRADRGERLVVPQSAVLHAGERSFVFRALGAGRFRPQQVEVGIRSGEELEILAGLAPGDEIVTSGTFLIASESRLRAALEQW